MYLLNSLGKCIIWCPLLALCKGNHSELQLKVIYKMICVNYCYKPLTECRAFGAASHTTASN